MATYSHSRRVKESYFPVIFIGAGMSSKIASKVIKRTSGHDVYDGYVNYSSLSYCLSKKHFTFQNSMPTLGMLNLIGNIAIHTSKPHYCGGVQKGTLAYCMICILFFQKEKRSFIRIFYYYNEI